MHTWCVSPQPTWYLLDMLLEVKPPLSPSTTTKTSHFTIDLWPHVFFISVCPMLCDVSYNIYPCYSFEYFFFSFGNFCLFQFCTSKKQKCGRTDVVQAGCIAGYRSRCPPAVSYQEPTVYWCILSRVLRRLWSLIDNTCALENIILSTQRTIPEQL